MNLTYRDLMVSTILTSVLASGVLLVAPACRAETDASMFLAELSAKEDLSRSERAALLESHVKGMQKSAFLEFVKQAAAEEGLYQSEEARQWAMIFYARWYLEGQGGNESFLSNL